METKVRKRLPEIKRALKEHKPLLEKRFKVKEIGIFGSYLRGRQRETSDLDLLVEFSEPIGLFDFLRLEDLLAKRIGVKVDLVMKDALKPRIKEKVIKEALYM